MDGGFSMGSEVYQRICVLKTGQSTDVQDSQKDLVLPKGNKLEQAEAAFEGRKIFKILGNAAPLIPEFVTKTISKVVFFSTLLFGCLLVGECKSLTVTEHGIRTQNLKANQIRSYDSQNHSTHYGTNFTNTIRARSEQQLSGDDSWRQINQSRLDKVVPESDSMPKYRDGYNDTKPSAHHDVDSLNVMSVRVEKQLLEFNSIQSQGTQSSRLHTAVNESGSMTNYTASYDDINPSTLDDSNFPTVILARSEHHLSRVVHPQSQGRQPSVLNTGVHELEPSRSYLGSYNDSTSSELNDADSNDVISAHSELRTSRFDSPESQGTQPSGLRTIVHEVSSMINYTSRRDTKTSALNDKDFTNVALERLERQPFGTKSPQSQGNQSSRLDIGVLKKGSVTSFKVSYDDAALNDSNFTGVTSAGPEQQQFRIVHPLGQENQSSGIKIEVLKSTKSTANYKDRNPARLSSTDLKPTIPMDPEQRSFELRSLRGLEGQSTHDSSQMRRSQFVEFDTPQYLETRTLPPGVKVRRGSAKHDPVSTLMLNVGNWQKENFTGGRRSPGGRDPQGQEPVRHKQNCDDLVAQCLAKIRQFSNSEGINKLISKSKTMSKSLNKSLSMGGLKLREALQKARECNCITSAHSVGQRTDGKMGQEGFRSTNLFGVDSQYQPHQDFTQPRPAKQQPSRSTTEEQQGGGFTKFQLECLKAHNHYRAKHGVPTLQLRKDLCETSQKYANFLAKTDPRERMEHSQYGENLSATGRNIVTTPQSVVADWYSEINNYNFETSWPIDDSQDYGHFTQVVWKDTTHVGCAYGVGASGATYVVCHYAPHGNTRYRSDMARAFLENVLPPL